MARHRLARSLLVTLVTAVEVAHAQGDGSAEQDAWAGIEEMVVVGTGAVGLLQEVTTSAVTFDESALRAEGITDISDLSNFTPNLEIKTAFAASNPTLFIRGVGLDDYNANSSSAVAVYQDGVYMNSPVGQLFQLYDTENVEVLRGPQPRLRNANAGAIMIHPKKPGDGFGGTAEISYGRFNRVTIRGAVDIPIVPELLASRFAFIVNKGDGTTKNRCNGRQGIPSTVCREADPGTHLDKWVNDTNDWAGRGIFRLTPAIGGLAPEILVNIHGGRNESMSAQFQHRGFQRRGQNPVFVPGRDRLNYRDTDGDPFAGDFNEQGREEISLFGTNVRITLPLLGDSAELMLLSAYEWHERDTKSNDDASPNKLFDRFNYQDEAWQFSQEATLEWDFADTAGLEEGTVGAGALVLLEDLKVNNSFPNVSRISTQKPLIRQRYLQRTRGTAIFAYLTAVPPAVSGAMEFLSNFKLEATARYSWERREFALESRATTFPFGGVVELPQKNVVESQRWRELSGDVTLTYVVGRHFDNEDVNLYAKLTRGWKPGQFNGGTALKQEPVEPVDPETVDSIELGLRSDWLDGRLGVDLTYFRYVFSDMQIFQLQQEGLGVPLPRLINAQEVNIQGVELELRASPIPDLDIQISAGWIDGQYEDFVTRIVEGGGNVLRPPEERVADFSGNPLLAAPEWNVTGSIQYAFESAGMGTIRPRYSFSYKDDVFFDPNEGRGVRGNLPKATLGQEAYWIHNAMLTYISPDGSIELSAWVRNFLDEHYRLQSFDLTEINFRFVVDAYADPRTYGFTAVLHF